MKQANLLPSLAMALLLYPATQAVAQTGSYPGSSGSQSSQSASQPNSTQSSQGSMQSSQGSSQQGSTQQGAMNGGGQYDAEIQSKLSRSLNNDKFKNVHATVQNGVVNLQGTVEMYSAK